MGALSPSPAAVPRTILALSRSGVLKCDQDSEERCIGPPKIASARMIAHQVDFAFAPFPSYEDMGFSRSPGAVKGARMRVHRSGAKTLDGEDDSVSWSARERGRFDL